MEVTTNNKNIQEPFFSGAYIGFIKKPFISVYDKFVEPDKIINFLKEVIDNYVGYQVVIKDEKLGGNLLSKMPSSINNLCLQDFIKVNVIFNNFVLDYFPKEISETFLQELLDDYNRKAMEYELNRYKDWIISKGGRDVINELKYRFGIA